MKPWDVLKVSPNATIDEIAAARRARLKEAHPDRNPGHEAAAAEQCCRIEAAYRLMRPDLYPPDLGDWTVPRVVPDEATPQGPPVLSALQDLAERALTGFAVDVGAELLRRAGLEGLLDAVATKDPRPRG